MKKILKYMLFAGLVLLTAACTKSDADEMIPNGEGQGRLQLSIALPGDSRAEIYNALEHGTLRIYKVTSGKSELIRKYSPATAIPTEIFLIAGNYKVTIEAGDKSEATFDHKSYYGEEPFTLVAHTPQVLTVKCKITNIAVRVVYDRTIIEKFDKSHIAYASAADLFSKTEAINNSVPSLAYPVDSTGFFLLPQGTSNISWGFYGDGTVLGKKEQIGVISNPVGGNLYTLTFKYSKTPDGYLSVSISTREYEEKYDDNFIFSPQPTLTGEGFNIDQVAPYLSAPVQFKLTSIDAISTVNVTANGVTYPILNTNAAIDPSATTNGIVYTPIDMCSGTIALNGTFFAKLPGGIHDLSFLMKDASNVEGKGTAHVAVPGIVPLAVSDYDLWSNTGTLKAIVTDPAITSVKISYRPANGTWKEITAVKGADYTYAARIEPTWTTVTNSEAQTVYTLDNTTGLWANRSYEYFATIGTTPSTTLTATMPTGDALPTLNSSGLSCYSKNNTSTANFWGSGNNGTTSNLCRHDSSISGAKIAAEYNSTTGLIGMFAPGNLFTGTFVQSGMNGTVSFGTQYTYTARPSAFTIHYKASIGTVDYDKHKAGKIAIGQPDKASIYAVIIDWSAPHGVKSGAAAPSGMWNPANGMNSVSEGKIIGYALINLTGNTPTMTTVDVPFHYYDKTARPTPGKYSLVISCATSAFGDYINGCSTNVIQLQDFQWKY